MKLINITTKLDKNIISDYKYILKKTYYCEKSKKNISQYCYTNWFKYNSILIKESINFKTIFNFKFFKKTGYSNKYKCWVYQINLSLFYINLSKRLNKTRFLNISLKPLEVQTKPVKTFIYFDEHELKKEYNSKWEIPTNENWKFTRNGKEINFRDINLSN